jgi:hypothetical protein
MGCGNHFNSNGQRDQWRLIPLLFMMASASVEHSAWRQQRMQ